MKAQELAKGEGHNEAGGEKDRSAPPEPAPHVAPRDAGRHDGGDAAAGEDSVPEAEFDHRRLGREMGLFFFHPSAPGMPYFLPRGLVVINELVAHLRGELARGGYQEVACPIVNSASLWERSGHWDHYRNDMFVIRFDEHNIFGLKPMNCPNAIVVFQHRHRSYRELPLRIAHFDVLHRAENSGSLHGLFRVQKFQQDDAHIFLAEDQVEVELQRIFDLAERFYALFGMKFRYRLSLRGEKRVGDDAEWDAAEADLRRALAARVGESGFSAVDGEGAFYAPKIDILAKDSHGREWQLGSAQMDRQLPRRFGLGYADSEGKIRMPVMIHRAICGSIERFLGVLLEHCGGRLPFWLSPVQVRVLPISERHEEAARSLVASLLAVGGRAELGGFQSSLASRVRQAQVEKIPLVVAIGDRELAGDSLPMRGLDGKVLSVGREAICEAIRRANAEKRSSPF